MAAEPGAWFPGSQSCVPYMLKPCLGPLRAPGDCQCPQDLALFASAWGRCQWLSPPPTPRAQRGSTDPRHKDERG